MKRPTNISLSEDLKDLALKRIPDLSQFVTKALLKELKIGGYKELLLARRSELSVELYKINSELDGIEIDECLSFYEKSDKKAKIDLAKRARLDAITAILELEESKGLNMRKLQDILAKSEFTNKKGILERFGTERWPIVIEHLKKEKEKNDVE